MRLKSLACALAIASPMAVAPVFAQEASYTSNFVRLAPGVPGVLYEPAVVGPKSAIAVFAMHSGGDYLTHSSCTELSKRGYRVLCANNSSSKSGASDDGNLDRIVGEMRIALDWLRKRPGVRKIVLFGHSGGATIQTAYQMMAEGGVASCQRAELIAKCSNDLAGMTPADGIVLADANWGVSTMTLFSIDPAVTDETTGKTLDPALDMFNPANGFVATGSSYSPAFVTMFLDAEGARNNAIVARAQQRLAAIEAGQGRFTDDEPFVVPGAALYGFNNRLFSQDRRLLSRSLKAWPLVRPDGSVVTQIIRSVRPAMNTENMSPSIRAAIKSSVRSYLNTYATRTTPAFFYGETSEIKGIDWRSNYANAPGNVQSIKAPLLTLGMTGGWEGLAAETIFNLSASPDKSIAFIEGATHVFTTCKRCETVPGQYGDTLKTTYDYIDGWLSKPGRFL